MRKDPFSIFNVNEFKKWMESSSEDNRAHEESLIGVSVISKVSFKKLRSVSEALDNEKAIMEFHKNGGVIVQEEEELISVKTNKGVIKLNKNYIIVN